MAEPDLILVTCAGGGVGGVGGKSGGVAASARPAVGAMAHHDDDRANALREPGADLLIVSIGVDQIEFVEREGLPGRSPQREEVPRA